MHLLSLIEGLSRSAAFPYPVESVEVQQTHISVVFLAGEYVYKLKKPVNPGFLDFTTLEKRLHFCQEEVRLNRRLAPSVYEGVVPITETDGALQFEGKGPAIEWAVKMRRLPASATLRERLRRGEVDERLVEMLAARIASFHRAAETSVRIASFGRLEGVSRLVMDIYRQSLPQVGVTVSGRVFNRLRSLAEESLERLRPLIELRASRNVPRDCHGDLHLDHVYYFPDQAPPGDLVIIDCIEFNERFRFIDPVADMAFPAMDLAYYGRRDLARLFENAYFQASGDIEGRALLAFYETYRATVRGSVEGLLLAESEISEQERTSARARSRTHWLVALTLFEEPERRPCLLLVSGLPGTGKSTLARALANRANFVVIRSDQVRKQLARPDGEVESIARLPESFYSAEWNERTYAECLRRAEHHLFEGERVLIDANFREEVQRKKFLDAAERSGVTGRLLICQAEPETIRHRLEGRLNDTSDADWAVYQRATRQWEEPISIDQRQVFKISTEGSTEEVVKSALAYLREIDLWR